MKTEPTFVYHIYHHEKLVGKEPFTRVSLRIPVLDDRKLTEGKKVQSLKNDMAELRRIGAEKGIVDPKLETVGPSTFGKELLVLKIGKGEQHKVLITGGHHAKEWNSVEVPYLIAKFLVENYTEDPSGSEPEDESADEDAAAAREARIAGRRRLKHLLENRQIWIVPMVNPDGHYWTMTKDRNWRMNCKTYSRPAEIIEAKQHGTGQTRVIDFPGGKFTGVDINRNYPTRTWGQETWLVSDDGKTMEPVTTRDPRWGGKWTGPWAGSEKETQAIANLIRQHRFRASISYHNFGREIFYFHQAKYLKHVGRGMRTLINEKAPAHYKWSDGNKVAPSTGHIADFCIEHAPGQPTLGMELPPTFKEADHYGYSWVPERTLEPTFRENLPAALALINSAGFSEPAGATRICADEATCVVQVVGSCWEVFKQWSL